MFHHPEGFHRGGADALGGGVGCQEPGVLFLKLLKLPHQVVVFGVANFRAVQHVVTVVMVVDFGTELFDFYFSFFRAGHAVPSFLNSFLKYSTGGERGKE